MEGNAASNILKILIIILIVTVVVAVVLMAIMLIFGVSMFGMRFVSIGGKMSNAPDAKQSVTLSSEGWANAETIDITTKGWNVELRPFSNADDKEYQSSEKGVKILYYAQYSGFVKGEVDAKLKPIVYGRNSVGEQALLIETLEPESVWISRASTKVVVLYDEGVLANKKVRIHTDGGAVYLGSTSTQYFRGVLSDVGITSKSGKITVGNIDIINSLDISKDKGDLYFNTDITGNLNLSINSGFGTVELQRVGDPNKNSGISVNLGKIQNSNITFDTIYGDLQYIQGNSGLIRGKLVTGSLIVNETQACVMKISNINRNVTFNSTAGSLYVGDIGGNLKSVMKGNGSINVKTIKGVSTIEALNGLVALGLDFDNKTSATGVRGDVDIKSDGGDIKVKCSDELSNGVLLKIRAKNSYVELSNIIGRVDYSMLDNGKSRIKANYKSLRGQSSLETHNGTIDVQIAQNSKAALKWSTGNRVNIEVSGCRSDEHSSDSFVDINGASHEQINLITLTSESGKITVKN
ncbi:MAG: hypothetical protein IKQ31_04340 [Clostridia bacterium]|nr:hypothetical protein [Clostridia bacterium]